MSKKDIVFNAVEALKAEGLAVTTKIKVIVQNLQKERDELREKVNSLENQIGIYIFFFNIFVIFIYLSFIHILFEFYSCTRRKYF